MSSKTGLFSLRRPSWRRLIPAFSIALATFAVTLPSLVAQPGAGAKEPDVLLLGNGEKLIGHLVRSTGDSVTFHSDTLGDVTVAWGKIKELHSTQTFAVIPKGVKLARHEADGKVAHGAIEMTDQKIAVTPGTGAGAAPIPVGDAAYVVDEKAFQNAVNHNPNFFEDWKGNITAGASLVEATQTSDTFTGTVNLVRAIPLENWLDPRNRTLLNFTASYGKVDQPGSPTIKTEILDVNAERDEYFSPRMYGFGSADFDHNYSQGLTLQQTYGVGVGWTVLKNDVRTLDLKANVGYESQEFAGATKSNNLIVSTFTESYRRKLPKGMLFTEQGTVTPAWNNSKAYSAVGGAGLSIPTYKRLAVSLNALDTFLNDPPSGFKKNSFQFTLGLTYALP